MSFFEELERRNVFRAGTGFPVELTDAELIETARQAMTSETEAAPEFQNIRSDPRWLPFLEGIGKAPQQLAAVNF